VDKNTQIDPKSYTQSWYTKIAKTPDEAEREYDQMSGSYDQVLALKNYRAPENASHVLAELLDPTNTGKILDAGCGTGRQSCCSRSPCR